jgi:PAS domain S-box-containing protein
MGDEARTREELRAEIERLRRQLDDLKEVVFQRRDDIEPFPKYFENLHDVYCRTDVEGNIVLASPSAERIFGYSVGELLGRNLTQDFCVNPEDRVRFLALMEAGGRVREFETQLRRKDGSVVWISINATYLTDSGGKVVGTHGIAKDVTEYRATQKLARHVETKYREVVDAARSVILRVDTTGVITFANAYTHEFFGFEKGTLEGRNVVGTIVPPVDSWGRDLSVMVAEIMENPEASLSNENENMKANGERVWIAWTNTCIRGADGRVAEILCVGNDVTGLKRTQDALARSEELYRLVTENVSDVIWSTSLEGTFTFLTQSVERVLGFEVSELVGQGLDAILTPSSFELATNILVERMASDRRSPTPPITLELQHVRKDGSTTWAEVHAKFVRDEAGKPAGVVGVTRDISERKKAEEALRKSEEWYRSLIDLGSTVYAVVDENARVAYESPSVTHVYGWEPGELAGTNILELVHPDDIAYAQREFAGLVSNPGRISTVTLRHKHKNGSWRIIEVVGTNLLASPAVGGIVLTSHDITDRKEVEARLRESEGQIDQLEQEVASLRSEVKGRYEFSNIVGRDPKMTRIFETILAVSQTQATVLILGETGTGKELVAKAIHYNSLRAGRPFVKVDCGVLAESLLESELFGHVRGAFTGAVKDRAGRFELATEGTIFLDEIQNLSNTLQAKLLRVVQDGTFERVGGGEVQVADVRVIAATNANLIGLVEKGEFRRDLYYRLNVIPIHLPPLREKVNDISLLAARFIAQFAQRHNKDVESIAEGAVELLMAHDWPGNVRELENVIEHAVVFCRGSRIEARDIKIQRRDVFPGDPAAAGKRTSGLREALELPEKQMILDALQRASGNRKRAAEMLGIGRTAFYGRLRRHGIPVKSRP